MFQRLLLNTLLAGAVCTAAWSQTQLAIRASETAFVRVDNEQRGLTTPSAPLKLEVTPGPHTVTVAALVGSSRQEVEVEAEANATTYVQVRLGTTPLPPTGLPAVSLAPSPSAFAAAGQSEEQQRQLDLGREQKEQRQEMERQQRDAKVRQLEQEVTVLERQVAAAENLKDQADRARQDCNNQKQQVPAWLGAVMGANCVLGEVNYNNAQQTVRRLRVEITGKQREVQRLDRQNFVY